jgi:hypothetical protein
MKSNTKSNETEGAKMNKKTQHRVSAIMVDYYMGKTGTTTKAQVLTRLAVVLGTHAEAKRVFEKIMR